MFLHLHGDMTISKYTLNTETQCSLTLIKLAETGKTLFVNL